MNTPDITAAQVVAIVQAVLGVLAAFSLPVTEAQSIALLGLVSVVAAVLLPVDAAIRRKRAEVFGPTEAVARALEASEEVALRDRRGV